jgi:hypothetical protein
MVARTLAAAREAGLEISVWFAPGDAGPPLTIVETVEHARGERLLT